MAKALLVMDMPESCNFCPISCYDEYHDYWCLYDRKKVRASKDGKLKNCPLQEVPKKKEEWQTVTYAYSQKLEKDDFAMGWNSCIDEILERSSINESNFKVDYKPSDNCQNSASYGSVCVKCGKCGREFNKNGRMTNE